MDLKKIISISLTIIIIFFCASCSKQNQETVVRTADTRNLSAYEYTVANIASADSLGRTVRAGDTENDKKVGVFYHVWHGYHNSGIYDITELLNNNPDALYNIFETEMEYQAASPLGEFHYWGQPLYGYYCSDDPWVITRHIELLTMAGVDYLVYDLTNSVIYYDAINAIFEKLLYFYGQGWDVPKVAFYTNTGSRSVINRCYDTWYKNGLYSDLWFRFNDKPLIIGVSSQLTAEEKTLYTEFFDFRESQWPFGLEADMEKGFPWMDWNYPQSNYNGTVSVSLAQHPGAKMSEGAMSNKGRGFDYSKYRNYSANTTKGTNYAGQWQTALANTDSVNNVFITGFNEWIAIKYENGQSIYFVDTFNQEYSRDIEMMKGGYADNYYLQTVDYVKQFKYSAAKHYNYNMNTVDINDFTLSKWAAVTANYKDFSGDAVARNFPNAAAASSSPGYTNYTDNSNRNDITDVSVTHDENYLYFKIVTLNDITQYQQGSLNWMNIFIKTGGEQAFEGYDYVINRSPSAGGGTSVEKSTGGYSWQGGGNAGYAVNGNVMLVKVPLSALGLSKDNCHIEFKVADNVTDYDSIEDYYVSGDSAPIGRLNYVYGY